MTTILGSQRPGDVNFWAIVCGIKYNVTVAPSMLCRAERSSNAFTLASAMCLPAAKKGHRIPFAG